MVLALPKAERGKHTFKESKVTSDFEQFLKGGEGKAHYDCIITLYWCCTHTLQNGVGFKNLLLDPGVLPAHCSQELQHELGALSFARS